MPVIGKEHVLQSGDSAELLEGAATSGGAHVRTRFVFNAAGLHAPPHRHPRQDETFEVISGTMAYDLDGTKHIAEPGRTVTLPKNVLHQHYSAGPQDTVVIQTITPGLDFDYIVENLFGLGSEGRGVQGLNNIVQGLIWIHKMKGPFFLGAPVWIQYVLASIISPLAYGFGYRAVYKRFSGEEW